MGREEDIRKMLYLALTVTFMMYNNLCGSIDHEQQMWGFQSTLIHKSHMTLDQWHDGVTFF